MCAHFAIICKKQTKDSEMKEPFEEPCAMPIPQRDKNEWEIEKITKALKKMEEKMSKLESALEFANEQIEQFEHAISQLGYDFD